MMQWQLLKNPAALVVMAFVCIMQTGCVSRKASISVPRISGLERDVITALLSQEARHPEKSRPILILNPTDMWMPQEETISEKPIDIPADVWAEMWRPVPASLREANRSTYDLAGLPLPAGALLYPKEQFEREYKSVRSFRSLVKRLGGIEPLVLSVSRPAIHDDRQSASVLLHVLSTWSGCGGVDEFRVSRVGDSWAVKLDKVRVVW